MSALFQPFSLRGLRLDNRIVISPMCQYSADHGQATAWHQTHLGATVKAQPQYWRAFPRHAKNLFGETHFGAR